MAKITFIGAGSTVFMKSILTDILLESELNSSEITLYDIDSSRLKTSQIVADKVASSLKVSASIKSTNDRKKALKEADFVIVMIQVGGYKPSTLIDFEIPAKYGLQQTIADTVGIGGIMRGLRTVPVLVEIAEEMLELCPRAMMLQYVNPMAINCLGLSHFVPELRYVGLCHSVQGTVADLARDIGEDFNKIEFECSGINHMSFFTKFAKKLNNGSTEDLYPKIFQKGETGDFGTNWDGCSNKVRYEVLKKLGYFVTESSEHFAEYVPWFIKQNRQDLIDQYKIPIEEYIDRCENNIKLWDDLEKDMTPIHNQPLKRGKEYASYIMDAVTNNNEVTINGNVMNDGYIDNLPSNCCVEVPCLINSNGNQPQKTGRLPEHLAALMRTNINVQILTAEAALTNKKEHIYHAAMLDPLTGANLSIDEIYSMVDKLIDAHGNYLPKYH